jgi:hypothetical protein
MATTFKTLLSNDQVSTRTLLHEAIPLTGSIVSGTYSDNNVKNYAHGMFQSVYDYPYLSSSANHVFDITVGYSAASELSSSDSVQNAKKINIYNQMAQVLMGHDHTGSILKFDPSGSNLSNGIKHQECMFLNFSRLLVKDEIKKGSFALDLLITNDRTDTQTGNIMRVADTNAANDFRVNSPAGEYGILYASDLAGTATGLSLGSTNRAAGLIFYQAGIAVLTGSVFMCTSSKGPVHGFIANGTIPPGPVVGPGAEMYNTPLTENVTFHGLLTGSAISASADAIRNRVYNVQFNNTTELNSTIYFCRVNHNDFNYSSNPTYLNGSKIRVKNVSTDTPVSYMTTVGLYSADNELLAVAKLSEPLKNDPTTELTLRVRLDY